MRVAQIGCGYHGRNSVAPAAQQFSKRAKLVAVCDMNPELAAMIPDVNRYTDYRDMIQKEKPDLVYVATLMDTHAELSIAAMRAGCHLICEKPMARGLDECKAMAEASKATNKHLFVNFETRLYPYVRQIRQWIDDGKLGRVEAIHLHHLWDGHKTTGPMGERRKRLMDHAGGLDCGIHKLDLGRYLGSNAAWRGLHAMGAWYGEAFQFPPHIAVLGRLQSGTMVTVNASMGFASQMKNQRPLWEGIEVIGDKGFAMATHDVDYMFDAEKPGFVARLTTDAGIETVPMSRPGHNEAIGWLLDEVARVVIDGNPIPPQLATAFDGLQAQWATETANAQAVAERAGR